MEVKKPLVKGQKFGRLTVISFHHSKYYISKDMRKRKCEWYLCKCDCGKEKIVNKNDLMSGHTSSCGCLQKENASKANKKHGFVKSRIYGIWIGIKKRCFNSNHKGYKNYGGRGIVMCDKWKNDFIEFYKWAIINGYKDNLTIDRINNEGNYEPSNCRWVTLTEQARNRRNTRFITYNGERLCMKDWAKKLGLNYKLVSAKINKGWPIKKAFNNFRSML